MCAENEEELQAEVTDVPDTTPFEPVGAEDYTADELTELNRRFDLRCRLDPDHGGIDPDQPLATQLVSIAECILAEYRAEMGETREEREVGRQRAVERRQATDDWLSALTTATEMERAAGLLPLYTAVRRSSKSRSAVTGEPEILAWGGTAPLWQTLVEVNARNLLLGEADPDRWGAICEDGSIPTDDAEIAEAAEHVDSTAVVDFLEEVLDLDRAEAERLVGG